MTIGIYKIENLIDHKVYIGQSLNIEERWKHHKRNAFCVNLGYDYPLYKAIRKYKLENFLFEIIEKCSPEILNEREQFWINYYNSYGNGYNQNLGGNNTQHISKLNFEIVKQIKKLLKEDKISEEEIGIKYSIGTDSVSAINTGESWYDFNEDYPIRKTKIEKARCKICNKILSYSINISNKTGLCKECYNEDKRKHIPSRNEIKEKIRIKSFESIANEYGFKSGNTIKKWCKNYNLPYLRSEINKISDSDWNDI